MDVLKQLITTKLRMKIIVKEGKRRCNWLKWNPWDGFMALAHTVTQNYTYQKSERAPWCKWLKWNLWDGSWFTSFSRVLPSSRVGYHAGKPIESVVYCLNINYLPLLSGKKNSRLLWVKKPTHFVGCWCLLKPLRIRRNKKNHPKVLPNRFHLNGNIIRIYRLTLKTW